MTELESEVLAARLTRICTPRFPGQFTIRYRPPEWGAVSATEGFAFDYKAFLSENVESEYEIHTLFKVKHRFTLKIARIEQGKRTGFLGYNVYKNGFLVDSRYKQEPFQQFAQQWTPYLCRGCWLSSCDMEASAHEKVEWIRGFTKEESEPWNLKM